jgi:DNA-binding protein WhiA
VSFTEDVRHELVERPPRRTCCQAAFLSGLLRQAGSLQMRSGGELAVVAELGDPAAARLTFALLNARRADTEILSYRESRFRGRGRVVLRLHGAHSLQLLHEVGVLSASLAPLPQPPPRVLARSCCRGAFLRGAFVAGGAVAAPRRPAHLELRAADLEAAQALCRVAARDELELHAIERRGHAIAYTKRRETVHDLLVHIGCQDAVLSLDEAEVVARTVERANRLTNCDRANLGRSSAAAHRQREAISQLDLATLAGPLREIADLRLANPECSLAELGERARPPLPKSTVARRMRVLLSITDR